MKYDLFLEATSGGVKRPDLEALFQQIGNFSKRGDDDYQFVDGVLNIALDINTGPQDQFSDIIISFETAKGIKGYELAIALGSRIQTAFKLSIYDPQLDIALDETSFRPAIQRWQEMFGQDTALKQMLQDLFEKIDELEEQGHIQEAFKLLKGALASEQPVSIHAALLSRSAGLFANHGKPDMAEKLYRRNLELSRSPEGLVNLASLLIRKKSMDAQEEAEKLLKEANSRFPKYLHAKKNLAYLYSSQNRKADAIAVIQEIFSIDPNNEWAMWLMMKLKKN